ncbi:histidinol-phosphate transaminase [Pantoea sp. Mhis]|uniref:histidinol-phosphate transaminase n=1 Tax=Pantoea sp. Mhis TaxID=2576759 RepID=UPI00195173B5|nr:histidinol-phosphate transaminase [Pantoea sp. Mhis]
MNIEELARTNIRKLTPYQSARRLGGQGHIWLNANEFPLPVSFKLSQKTLLNRYPECQPKLLIERYSSYVGLMPEQILISRGADEGIELIMRTFCEPGKDAILFCTPTYGMYRVIANTIGIRYISIPMLDNWQLNLSAIVNNLDGVKVIYICRPNNPTGNLINLQDIKQLLLITMYKTLIVIDEAYIEFCSFATLTNWLHKYHNIIILRTLSKAFALAGLRCGFTLANKSIIDLLLKVITPYPIAIPTADIASKALSKYGIHLMCKRVVELNHNRNWLYNQLLQIPYITHVYPSEANYILVRFINSSKVFDTLSNEGIILRDQNKIPKLTGCLRISIGTSYECEYIIKSLKNLSMEQ